MDDNKSKSAWQKERDARREIYSAEMRTDFAEALKKAAAQIAKNRKAEEEYLAPLPCCNKFGVRTPVSLGRVDCKRPDNCRAKLERERGGRERQRWER